MSREIFPSAIEWKSSFTTFLSHHRLVCMFTSRLTFGLFSQRRCLNDRASEDGACLRQPPNWINKASRAAFSLIRHALFKNVICTAIRLPTTALARLRTATRIETRLRVWFAGGKVKDLFAPAAVAPRMMDADKCMKRTIFNAAEVVVFSSPARVKDDEN